MSIADGRDQRVEVGLEFVHRSCGPGQKLVPRDLLGIDLTHVVDGDLAPVPRVLADAAAHLDGAPRFKGAGAGGVRVPQDGRHAACAIREREAQVGRAVALVSALDGADEQDPVDGRPVGQVGEGSCGGGECGHGGGSYWPART